MNTHCFNYIYTPRENPKLEPVPVSRLMVGLIVHVCLCVYDVCVYMIIVCVCVCIYDLCVYVCMYTICIFDVCVCLMCVCVHVCVDR